MKKRIFISLVIVGMMMGVLCSCNDAKQSDSAYAISSSIHSGGMVATSIVDINMGDLTRSVSDPVELTATVGLGWSNPGAENTVAGFTVTATGCVIQGQNDQWSKIYEDFHDNEAYLAKKDTDTFLWYEIPTLQPVYHEQITITFPQGECSGRIVISNYEYSKFDSQDYIDEVMRNTESKVTIYYAKNQDGIAFSTISVQRAIENLAEMDSQ